MVKNLPANAGGTRDTCSTPGLGRSPGTGHGNMLQYFYLENSMNRKAWQATVCDNAELNTTGDSIRTHTVLSCFSRVRLIATACTVACLLGCSVHGVLHSRVQEWIAPGDLHAHTHRQINKVLQCGIVAVNRHGKGMLL